MIRRSSPCAIATPKRRSASRRLPVARATLGYRGYTREISPDGGQPLLYDYDYVDPAPLASFQGKLTRHGDVTPLLRADDDQLCLVGPATKPGRVRRRGAAGSASGLDAELCPPRHRLLQGRRPVHRHERHGRAAPLADDAARFRSRSESQAPSRPRVRDLSPRVSDSSGRGRRSRR